MYKTQALEAYKVSLVLKGVSLLLLSFKYLSHRLIFTNNRLLLTLSLQMNEKLDYLDKLKNNMGEEMAEMMSEEITKVMDEQREME